MDAAKKCIAFIYVNICNFYRLVYELTIQIIKYILKYGLMKEFIRQRMVSSKLSYLILIISFYSSNQYHLINWLLTCSHIPTQSYVTDLSLELICSALASILAPMSPMAFPLMSSLVSEELLPRALRTMVRSLFSLESARDKEVRGCGGQEEKNRIKCWKRVYMTTRGKI